MVHAEGSGGIGKEDDTPKDKTSGYVGKHRRGHDAAHAKGKKKPGEIRFGKGPKDEKEKK